MHGRWIESVDTVSGPAFKEVDYEFNVCPHGRFGTIGTIGTIGIPPADRIGNAGMLLLDGGYIFGLFI